MLTVAARTTSTLEYVQRRIMGIETEFGVTCTFHGHRRLSPGRGGPLPVPPGGVLGPQLQRFPAQRRAALPRRRVSHPEYATAECDSLVQLVTHDRAGERVLEDLLIDAEQRLADEGIGGDIYLFKNNTDSAGNSYGCHENYLIVRAGEFSRISDVLLPFLVTRQLICGAGKVLQTPKAATFCLSPARRAHLGGRLRRPPPAAGRSSTPATSRTPTPRSTAGCTSSSATPTCASPPPCSRWAPPRWCWR